MGIDRFEPASGSASPPVLSGRARTALQQHQRRLAVLQRELLGVDRVLAGALTACDGASQHEMLGAYLEAVQELRVCLQRLEGFLMQRLGTPAGQVEPDAIEMHPFDYGTAAEAAPTD